MHLMVASSRKPRVDHVASWTSIVRGLLRCGAELHPYHPTDRLYGYVLQPFQQFAADIKFDARAQIGPYEVPVTALVYGYDIKPCTEREMLKSKLTLPLWHDNEMIESGLKVAAGDEILAAFPELGTALRADKLEDVPPRGDVKVMRGKTSSSFKGSTCKATLVLVPMHLSVDTLRATVKCSELLPYTGLYIIREWKTVGAFIIYVPASLFDKVLMIESRTRTDVKFSVRYSVVLEMIAAEEAQLKEEVEA